MKHLFSLNILLENGENFLLDLSLLGCIFLTTGETVGHFDKLRMFMCAALFVNNDIFFQLWEEVEHRVECKGYRNSSFKGEVEGEGGA